MKKSIGLGLCLFLGVLLFAQEGESADDLIQRGIHAHDQGNYAEAVDYYQRALKLEPESPLIYYEMAFSYYYDGQYQQALESAETGIVWAGDDRAYLGALYDIKGSALDSLGRGEEAAAVFIEAIERFETQGTLLYYNLGLTYYRMERYDEALAALTLGVEARPRHASGNYLVGRLLFDKGRPGQGILCLYHFLLLEPQGWRANEAYELILNAFSPGETVWEDSPLGKALGGMAAELSGSAGEFFTQRTLALFAALEKLPGIPGGDLWGRFYIPFFTELAQRGHGETYCGYVSAFQGDESWFTGHREELERFFAWLNEQE